ncbi:MAG TPA: hypothetical protein VGJ81_14905 [Thermoanaerobaculia bacterium]|jgi:hypothetical protein
MNVLEIPEVARLNERMLYVQQCVENAPQPEAAFLGLSHAKMRRTIARIRAGKYVPKDRGDLTPEQIADALERTIVYEETMKWARAEAAEIQRQLLELQGAAYARAMDGAVKIFFAGKQLAKEKGPDSDVAKSLETMKRSWRAEFPRTKKTKRKAKEKGAASSVMVPV